MSQYQRMVSYLYEYKQGVKGVNVGYVRIEQRGSGCRISLQMRSRNLGQLSEVSIFRQGTAGIRYYTIGTLIERNGNYQCRIETESANMMGSGISLSDVDGIVLYLDDNYYIATTWKNQGIWVGRSRIWDPDEVEPESEAPELETSKSEPEGKAPELETSKSEPEVKVPELGTPKSEIEGKAAESEFSETVSGAELESAESKETVYDCQDTLGQDNHMNNNSAELPFSGQNGNAVMGQRFPKWSGIPLFRRRPAENANIPIPQMTEWGNGNNRMAEANHSDRLKSMENSDVAGNQSRQDERISEEQKEQLEKQAICDNCPFKRKSIDYGKRILMTFPVMRPFPDDQNHACVRIEPQDLGCLPMQMWTLANNHFLLQGYYCYRHLIFMESGENSYILGVPGIYDRRTCHQARQFGFSDFRSICSGKQCEGAFGYWVMHL